MKKEKIIEVGADGGSIIGYEIKDENGKIINYAHQTEEHYYEDFTDIGKENYDTSDFKTFWKLLTEKYPIYFLYPVFIKEEYKKIIGEILAEKYLNEIEYEDDLREQRFVNGRFENWFKATGKNFEEYRNLKIEKMLFPDKFEENKPIFDIAVIEDDFVDFISYIAIKKTKKLDLTEFNLIYSAFMVVWNEKKNKKFDKKSIMYDTYYLILSDIKNGDIEKIDKEVVLETISLMLDYLIMRNLYDIDEIYDDTI